MAPAKSLGHLMQSDLAQLFDCRRQLCSGFETGRFRTEQAETGRSFYAVGCAKSGQSGCDVSAQADKPYQPVGRFEVTIREPEGYSRTYVTSLRTA